MVPTRHFVFPYLSLTPSFSFPSFPSSSAGEWRNTLSSSAPPIQFYASRYTDRISSHSSRSGSRLREKRGRVPPQLVLRFCDRGYGLPKPVNGDAQWENRTRQLISRWSRQRSTKKRRKKKKVIASAWTGVHGGTNPFYGGFLCVSFVPLSRKKSELAAWLVNRAAERLKWFRWELSGTLICWLIYKWIVIGGYSSETCIFVDIIKKLEMFAACMYRNIIIY